MAPHYVWVLTFGVRPAQGKPWKRTNTDNKRGAEKNREGRNNCPFIYCRDFPFRVPLMLLLCLGPWRMHWFADLILSCPCMSSPRDKRAESRRRRERELTKAPSSANLRRISLISGCPLVLLLVIFNPHNNPVNIGWPPPDWWALNNVILEWVEHCPENCHCHWDWDSAHLIRLKIILEPLKPHIPLLLSREWECFKITLSSHTLNYLIIKYMPSFTSIRITHSLIHFTQATSLQTTQTQVIELGRRQRGLYQTAAL